MEIEDAHGATLFNRFKRCRLLLEAGRWSGVSVRMVSIALVGHVRVKPVIKRDAFNSVTECEAVLVISRCSTTQNCGML